LALGDRLEPLTIDPVRAGPMKVIAALQDDPNPIHWDAAAAARAGLGERVINQGPITISWLLRLAAREAGGAGGVRELRARFLGNVREGDRVECGGTASAIDEIAGEAVLELFAVVDGVEVAEATARIRSR
jgi:acyl dehydratase